MIEERGKNRGEKGMEGGWSYGYRYIELRYHRGESYCEGEEEGRTCFRGERRVKAQGKEEGRGRERGRRK